MKCEKCDQEIEKENHICNEKNKELSKEVKELLYLDQVADTAWDMLYFISDKH